jgi:multidrug efflux pump subunit AcrB
MILKQLTLPSVVLALLLAAGNLFGGPPEIAGKPQPIIVVEASYPGASAVVVADTVAAPIEQQVNGVQSSLLLRSRCTNEGRYLLAVTFKPGTDLDKAIALVQNRVALALPALPDAVKRGGVTVKKKSPVRMIVSLTAPEGRYDTLYLSNYATIQVQDLLVRIAGVGEVTRFGQRDYSMRIWLDPEKLAARNLVAGDVVKALEQQNVQIAVGQIGQPPADKKDGEIIVTTLGRLAEPAQFEDIIVKTDGKAGMVRLKDVGRVELAASSTDSYVSLNGKPGVVLGIYPTGGTSPKDLSRAVADRIAMLGAHVPEGLRLEVAFDFTANLEAPGRPKTAEYLLIDVELPESASVDRRRETLTRCDKLLHDVAGVQDVLALNENPFDIIHNQPCILVRLAAADKRKISREEVMRTIRTKLEKIPDAVLRLRDLSRLGGFPRCGYPIDLAVNGPEADKVRELAQQLVERLQESKKLTDVWANQESTPRPCLYVDIDRTKAAAQGVALQDIFRTLEVSLGSTYINDSNRFGRTWQVVVQTDDKFRKRLEDLKQIKLRNDQGQMIPLASVAAVKTRNAPGAIIRLDLRPMVEITANPAAEVSRVQARTLCETLLEQIRKESRLSTEYRITWLQEIPTQK